MRNDDSVEDAVVVGGIDYLSQVKLALAEEDLAGVFGVGKDEYNEACEKYLGPIMKDNPGKPKGYGCHDTIAEILRDTTMSGNLRLLLLYCLGSCVQLQRMGPLSMLGPLMGMMNDFEKKNKKKKKEGEDGDDSGRIGF